MSKFTVICGPCALKSGAENDIIVTALTKVAYLNPDVEFIFKGSYDKANRTSYFSQRGVGIVEGLHQLDTVRKRMRVTTDVHDISEVRRVAAGVDIVQVPAFLCRQTDLLTEVGQRARAVSIKKGQFMRPEDMQYAMQKVRIDNENKRVILIERGYSFGYGDLVADMRSIEIMRGFCDDVIFDATHSVQTRQSGHRRTTGEPSFIPCLAKAAVAAGATGIFLETLPDPSRSISDGDNMLPLNQTINLIKELIEIRRLIIGQEENKV